MNRLPIEKRAQIIGLLVEGMSLRAVSRIVGCSINTVTKLLEEVGFACNMYQSEHLPSAATLTMRCW
jgi:transposase-like protein